MLRLEARRRLGQELNPADEKLLDNFLARLREGDLVVHYDPDTEAGWHFIRRGSDDEPDSLVRKPSASKQ